MPNFFEGIMNMSELGEAVMAFLMVVSQSVHEEVDLMTAALEVVGGSIVAVTVVGEGVPQEVESTGSVLNVVVIILL